ncbi:MAG: hypothetical protein ACTSX9_07440 [Candidatus Njordarchaeales archaeon]
MRYVVILRYSGEIAIKSPRVKRQWEKLLVDHVKERVGKDYGVEIFHSRILVYVDNPRELDEVEKNLRTLLGFSSLSSGLEVRTSIPEILQGLKKMLSDGLVNLPLRFQPLKFVMTNLRPRDVIDVLQSTFDKNDEKEPTDLYIEVRGEKTFLLRTYLQGPGGVPFGTQDKLVSLMSGGPDSTLSTWMMMRRGSPIAGIYIPMGSEKARQRAIKAAIYLFSNWTPTRSGKLYVVPIEEILNRISEVGGDRLSHVLFKRYALRVAEIIATYEGAVGIVTGELAGEHASQTIWNLSIITQATALPVYRPVLGFDKNEVLMKLKEVDPELFEIVNIKVEECSRIVPRWPVTHVELSEIRRAEKKIGFLDPRELIDLINNNGNVLHIKNFRVESVEEVKISSISHTRFLEKRR